MSSRNNECLRRQKRKRVRQKGIKKKKRNRNASLFSSNLYPEIFYPRCGRIRPFASACFEETVKSSGRGSSLKDEEEPTRRMKKGRRLRLFGRQ